MEWTNFLICLLFGWLGAHKFREKKYGIGILYLLTLGVFGIGWIYDTVRYLLIAVNGKSNTGPVGQSLGEHDPLPTVLGHGLLLKAGEVCHYYAEAASIKVKTAVTGYSGGSSGVSVRITKGVSYRVGQRKSTPIRGTVQERHPGWLAITSARVVFTSSQESFDKNIENLSSMNLLDDGIVLQFGSRQYIIETKEAPYIQQIINRIYQAPAK